MNTRQSLQLSAMLLLVLLGNAMRADSPIRPGTRIAIVGNTFADQFRMHGYLETFLLQHSEGEPVSIRNLGWGGDMLSARDRPTNFPTEESTLVAHQTDVVIAFFGMGESFEGEGGLADFKSDLRAFIASHEGKRYNGESPARLILVSPIAYEDLGRLTPKLEARNRDLKRYTQAMAEVASGADIPFVDLFEPTRILMEGPSSPQLTTNGIHLNSLGYWAVARILYERLTGNGDSARHQPWQLTIDAKNQRGEARGVGLSQVSSDRRQLSFRVKEETSPALPPPTDRSLPEQLSSHRDTLIVKNLEPGDYVLMVDGEKVASASHLDWAEGIAVDSSPAHQAAESFRSAVNDKNQQFTYSWKALNQVHIVGERRNSPSGRALPAEVIEFDKLAKAQDEALNRRSELKTREWRLIPDAN